MTDGDTVVLERFGRTRLIGINAPELKGEPLAVSAATRLRELVPVAARVWVAVGEQPRDRYGRTLAHLFLPSTGTSVEATLLREGLAFQVVIPPNTEFVECFAAAEAAARREGLGVWSEAEYRVRPVSSLSPEHGGFSRVRGTIMQVRESRRGWWLALDGPLALRLAKKNLHHFPEGSPEGWVGRELVVRGWIAKNWSERWEPLMMQLGHPRMIEP